MSERYYSAEQVICLAAYGSTLMPSDPAESTLRERITEKWGEQILKYEPVEKVGDERKHPCVLAMRKTLLRCQWRKKRGLISAQRWAHLSPKLAKGRARQVKHVLRKADSFGRDWIRIIVRLSGKSMAEVMTDLRGDLRPLYRLRGKQLEQIAAATARVIRDLASARIRLQGRIVRKDQNGPVEEHEPVPTLYFEPKWRTITVDNKACCNADAPLHAQRGTQHEWWCLRFVAADVDRLYRPVTVGDQGIAGSGPSRIANFAASRNEENATKLQDLPADWTLDQTVAWIMFRDPVLVRKVDNVGRVRFASLLAAAEFECPSKGLPDRWSSEKDMLIRLRAGDIRSKGQIAGDDEPQFMDPREWTKGNMAEESDQSVLRRPRFSKKFWFDITLIKAEIIAIWPPIQPYVSRHGEPPDEPISAPASVAISTAVACPLTTEACMGHGNTEQARSTRASHDGLQSLEAALSLGDGFERPFDNLPQPVQLLARAAFSFGDSGPLLWDLYSPVGRLGEARRWDFEQDPANDALLEKMWLLRPTITREITQIESDAIPRLQATPAAEARDFELRRLWRRLAVLKADERNLLSAGRDKIHSVVDRLWKCHAHLVSPSDLPLRYEEHLRLPERPMNTAGLPPDAWFRATEVFAWLAFADASKFVDFWDRAKASPNIMKDAELNAEIIKLGDACDITLEKVRSETCFAYQVGHTTEMKRIPSWVFRHGITINIFHGVLEQTHEDLNTGRELISTLRNTGSGQVWFRRDELLSAMDVDKEASTASKTAHVGTLHAIHDTAPALASDGDTGPGELAPTAPLRRASERQIHATIRAVYDLAEAEGMKPPNLKEIGHPVRWRLRAIHLNATITRIMELAAHEDHAPRRRAQGERVNRSLPAFSDPEDWKTGVRR